MSARPAPDTDAAMVLGMASTAMPFADTSQAEAERWLRILRLHGEAGTALQALGVSEAPLEKSREDGHANPGDGAADRDVVAAGGGGAAPHAPPAGGAAGGARDAPVPAV